MFTGFYKFLFVFKKGSLLHKTSQTPCTNLPQTFPNTPQTTPTTPQNFSKQVKSSSEQR